MSTAGMITETPLPVDLQVPLSGGLPIEQRRWTIAIRLILLVPQYIVLFFVAIAVFFALIAGWFAALFTGKLPSGIRGFLMFFIRWSTRVTASVMLLTDSYPPFNGDESSEFPIGIIFPEATSLNRASVLFRLILVFPAYLIHEVLYAGVTVFAIPFWIAALILGRLPEPVFRVSATLVRFSTRLYSYFFMVTPCYPWGWKGDVAQVQDTGPIPAAPSAAAPGLDASAAPVESEGGALPGYPAPTTSLEAAEEGKFDFALAGWSQAWVWIILVVGAIVHFQNTNFNFHVSTGTHN
jgi:hypothetical protein